MALDEITISLFNRNNLPINDQMYFNLGNHTKYGQDTYAYNLSGDDPLTHQFKYSTSMYTKVLMLNEVFKPATSGRYYNYDDLRDILIFKFGGIQYDDDFRPVYPRSGNYGSDAGRIGRRAIKNWSPNMNLVNFDSNRMAQLYRSYYENGIILHERFNFINFRYFNFKLTRMRSLTEEGVIPLEYMVNNVFYNSLILNIRFMLRNNSDQVRFARDLNNYFELIVKPKYENDLNSLLRTKGITIDAYRQQLKYLTVFHKEAENNNLVGKDLTVSSFLELFNNIVMNPINSMFKFSKNHQGVVWVLDEITNDLDTRIKHIILEGDNKPYLDNVREVHYNLKDNPLKNYLGDSLVIPSVRLRENEFGNVNTAVFLHTDDRSIANTFNPTSTNLEYHKLNALREFTDIENIIHVLGKYVDHLSQIRYVNWALRDKTNPDKAYRLVGRYVLLNENYQVKGILAKHFTRDTPVTFAGVKSAFEKVLEDLLITFQKNETISSEIFDCEFVPRYAN